MSKTTKAQSAALASVCRIVKAAERHGRATIDVQELEAALDGVDVEGLADPRPCEIRNVGRPLGVVASARS